MLGSTALGLTGSDYRLWAFMMVMSSLAGLVIYFGFGGVLYWRYYVKRKDEAEAWKLQPRRWLKPELERWAVRVAFGNLALAGLLSGSFAFYVMKGGYTTLYFDHSRYPIWWTVVSTVLCFIALEAAAYYTHRWLHNKWMFKHIHRWHHRCIAPNPFTTVTMHPVEFLLFQATAFIPVFTLPVHVASFVGLLIYVLVFNIMDHSGIRIVHKLPWQSSSAYHDDHHVHFHCNFGQNLMFFDRFHGTLRRKNRRYGEKVFGGKGEPNSSGEGSGEVDEFYEY